MKRTMVGAVLVGLIAGCGVGEGSAVDHSEAVATTGARLSWEAFLARAVYREPDTGVLIADGDTPFVSEKQLREFYELHVREGQLIVNRVGSADDTWNASQKLNLTYCVADTFGARKAAVVQAMAEATAAWMGAANVKFVYLPGQDASCTKGNANVLFDVRPVSANGAYLARAFFPSTARAERNLLIDGTAFTQVSLAGVLRHELGHALGFRHEHTRPEAGTCFEDSQWRSLTAYDAASVMHYPDCNGAGDWFDLSLTALDRQGAAALYGPPAGAGAAPTPTVPPTAGTTVERFSGSVAQGASKAFGPFAVTPGSTMNVGLTGTGDADLYVRFGAAPTASKYDCRPYLDGSTEGCSLTVPATASIAYVTVTGYTAATFSLRVEYVKSSATSAAPTAGSAQTGTASGAVSAGQQVPFDAIAVLPGSALTVTMTGSGDPDLYVRFGSAPTLTLFDCRPYVSGASEACSLSVPAGASQVFLMVHGYSAGTYALTVNYVAP